MLPTKRTSDREGHAHFVTFSCYKRRRLLDHDRAKNVVLGVFNSELTNQDGRCIGFIVMPDHVHAIVWFSQPDQLSHFTKQSKQRSSAQIKRLAQETLNRYFSTFDPGDPNWQQGYYDFNLFNEEKIKEKLTYMHQNPVKAGFAETAGDWPWSSARSYEEGRSIGVPISWLQ